MIFPFRINPFTAQILALSCIFCIGLAFASCARFFFHSKKSPAKAIRFSSACFFLTLAVIFYTILIFYSESLFWISDFSEKNPAYYQVLTAVFLLGFVISFFWKVALPLFLVLYLFLTLFTNYILTSAFGNQKLAIPIHIEKESDQKSIDFISCHLPDTLILPVKRNWFCLPENFYKNADGKKDRGILKNPPVDFYMNKILLKNLSGPESFPLPENDFYPALYSAHISFDDDRLACQITLDL